MVSGVAHAVEPYVGDSQVASVTADDVGVRLEKRRDGDTVHAEAAGTLDQ